MKKVFYKKCKYCGRENECYEEHSILKHNTRFRKKGDKQIIIRCKKLDEINKEAAKTINNYLNKNYN